MIGTAILITFIALVAIIAMLWIMRPLFAALLRD